MRNQHINPPMQNFVHVHETGGGFIRLKRGSDNKLLQKANSELCENGSQKSIRNQYYFLKSVQKRSISHFTKHIIYWKHNFIR